MNVTALAPITETGKLNIMHLKRFWSRAMLKRHGKIPQNAPNEDWQLDKTLLFTLGLGLEQTLVHVFHEAPSFEQFEDWVINTSGEPSAEAISHFNRSITGEHIEDDDLLPEIFNAEELVFWDKNGYIILKNAIPQEDCAQTVDLICEHIGVDKNDPESWYKSHPSRQGVMVQLFQHPLLQKNRQSARIRQAFEQLWRRKDIWVTVDRVGFNPPVTPKYSYQGFGMHWDVSLQQLPVPYSLQGILYLTDTAENQGAFTLVPGFQHKLEAWLKSLPPGADPRKQDLHALGSKPIAASAGDLIIWQQALPHGSSPNTHTIPRYVQYITYEPADYKHPEQWK